MNIYISGISGTGMGPLALMAKQAGHTVFGSDKNAGPIVPELEKENIEFEIGKQDGEFLNSHDVDWFVYTSALPKDHPELKLATEKGIKCTKRDEFINFLVEELNLKMVAVAGTHGKTTTTSMIIWACQKLGIDAAYLVGTTLGFAESGKYVNSDKFFIYEADEYDRNFLKFHPWLSCITFVSYDHPDIYKTEEEYKEAFKEFESQSEKIIRGGEVDDRLSLAGAARREDATTAMKAVKEMLRESGIEKTEEEIIETMNSFPGVGRRFEKISEGVYSDYAHHPEEIEATIEIANEESERLGRNGVVAIYEPHQNTRQHEVKDGYKTVFDATKKVFWLPTYLTREDESLKILTPEDFIKDLADPGVAEPAEMDDELARRIKNLRDEGYLILLMTAGPADAWLRKIFM
jgi:UDP-N-acetylmuramate--alanine ligase